MTLQIPNSITLNNESFNIIRFHGGNLFTPQDIGILPVANMSACWRGYVSTYKINNNFLVLDELRLSSGYKMQNVFLNFFYKFFPRKAHLINRVKPTPSKPEAFFIRYENINLTVNFTGTILIARDFIGKYWAYRELNPDWAYRTVLELKFAHGKSTGIQDVSSEFEKKRNQQEHSTAHSDKKKNTTSETSNGYDNDDDNLFAEFR